MCQRPLTRLYSLTVPILPLANSIANNNIGAEGACTLTAILKETQIQELECATAPEHLLLCQCPLTRLVSHRPATSPALRSLWSNHIGAEGASALAAILKETQISDLKCAAAPRVFAFVSAPVDMLVLSHHLRSAPCLQSRF